MKKIIISFFALLLIISPIFVGAQEVTGGTPAGGGPETLWGGANETPLAGGGGNFLENPLKAANIQELLADILDIIVQIGTVFMTMMIIYAGFLFVWSRGKPGDLEKAKDAIKWTLIGAALILAAFVIATALRNTVEQLGSVTPSTLAN